MITFDYLFFCDALEEHDHKLYILGGDFNQVTVTRFPHTWSCVLATRLSAAPEDSNTRVPFTIEFTKDGADEPMHTGEWEVHVGPVADDPNRVTAHSPLGIHMPLTTFKEPGKYHAILKLNGREEQRATLYVIEKPKPPQTQE